METFLAILKVPDWDWGRQHPSKIPSCNKRINIYIAM
jgi:hypothetical protein